MAIARRGLRAAPPGGAHGRGRARRPRSRLRGPRPGGAAAREKVGLLKTSPPGGRDSRASPAISRTSRPACAPGGWRRRSSGPRARARAPARFRSAPPRLGRLPRDPLPQPASRRGPRRLDPHRATRPAPRALGFSSGDGGVRDLPRRPAQPGAAGKSISRCARSRLASRWAAVRRVLGGCAGSAVPIVRKRLMHDLPAQALTRRVAHRAVGYVARPRRRGWPSARPRARALHPGSAWTWMCFPSGRTRDGRVRYAGRALPEKGIAGWPRRCRASSTPRRKRAFMSRETGRKESRAVP